MAAERRQIYELLVATHAQALRMNAELADQRCVLERSCRSLAILHGMAAALNEAAGETGGGGSRAEHLLALPGWPAPRSHCAWMPYGVLAQLATRGHPCAARCAGNAADDPGAVPAAAGRAREVGVLNCCRPARAGRRRTLELLDSAAASSAPRSSARACTPAWKRWWWNARPPCARSATGCRPSSRRPARWCC
jgi:hypothetical protein